MWHNTHVLAGAAVAGGLLWWLTTNFYGGWVFWTVLLLGVVLGDAFYAAVALVAAWRSRGEVPGRD
ncbi:hypothetical protein BAY60_01435 [Prauserella muralis]|uniref:Uncharacterized protein n=1 Tax=Prauserella muralis TaxID=588067 RepID=A0A2V4B7I2_9PSEU|nr:hypothetical protein BAY60_01435 [Prauserella muralis]